MAREYKIGERFEYLGDTYEAVEDHDFCEGCAFYVRGLHYPCVRPDMVCDAFERSDKTDVKFKVVE